MRALVRRVWNGGLCPETADAEDLRQRRTVATTTFALVPLGGLVVVCNSLLVLNPGQPWYGGYNAWVVLAIGVVLIATIAQGFCRWRLPTGHLCILAYYAAPTLSMADSGMQGNAWTWHLGMPVLATLVVGGRAGLAWSVTSMMTMWWYGLHQIGTDVGGVEGWYVVDEVRLIESTLLMLFLTVAAQAFRSAQVATQGRLQVAIDELQKEVEIRREAEIRAQQAAEAAQAASEAKARFLATMSHEIRTPMNGVLGATHLMRETRLTPEQVELLETVHASGEVLLGVINDVLDYSQLEADRTVLESVAVDVRALLKMATSPLRLEAVAKGIELSIEVDPSLPSWLMGDPNRLRQIALNLSANAVKFTERGTVRVRAVGQPSSWRLEVIDTGIGVDQASIDALFSPFVQAEISTRRRYGGSGLGLAIVRQLASAMGGTCGAQSEVGKGSFFWVSLPLTPAMPPASAKGSCDVRSVSCKRVLLVDDNPVNRMVAARMLTKQGHSVVQAENGAVALQRLEVARFDIAFMDVQMPVVDGYEATRALRKLTTCIDLPVVGLTANALPGDREKVLSAGMNDYLAKPVRPQQLQATIDRWT